MQEFRGFGHLDSVDVVDGLASIIGRRFWMNNIEGSAYDRANRETDVSLVVDRQHTAISQIK